MVGNIIKKTKPFNMRRGRGGVLARTPGYKGCPPICPAALQGCRARPRGEKLVDATVYITDSKTGERITQGRTYMKSKSNPKEFILIPGSYSITVSITVKALNIEGKPEKTFDVEIKAQGTSEVNADFSN